MYCIPVHGIWLKMASIAGEDNKVLCEDFGQFQEALKEMRMIDDKIIYALNTTVPTTSFKGQVDATSKCKELYGELSSAYKQREGTIKRCISEISVTVNDMKEYRDRHPDDLKAKRDLRKQQGKLRLMQSELNIEEVVKDRSLKVFHERCRNHYVPQQKSEL